MPRRGGRLSVPAGRVGRRADQHPHVVPPRPAARRQPGAAGGLRRRRRAAAVRPRPGAVGTGGHLPPVVPHPVARGARRVPAGARRRAVRRPRRPGASGWSRPRGEVGADRVHVAADYGPYGRRRDLDVEKALADAGVALVRTGSPYAVAPDRVKNGSGRPYQVYTPFSRGWLEHGWRDPVDAPERVGVALAGRAPSTCRSRSCPTGSTCRRPARRPPAAAWAAYVEEHLRRLRRRAEPPRPGQHQPDVAAPQVGRDPPADDARRPRGPLRQGRR